MVRSKNPNYYTYNEKKRLYQIRKTINGEFHYFGEYTNKHDTEFLVRGLKKADWDINKLEPKYKEKLKLGQHKPKGYSKDKRTGKYVVRKYINGKVQHYGTVPTEEEAIRYSEALEKVNYQVELLPEEFKEYIPQRVTAAPKYYHYNERLNQYIISKRLNGETLYIGAFDNEVEAEKVVEALKKCNWDVNKCREVSVYGKKISLEKKSNKSKKVNMTKRGKTVRVYNPGCLSNPRYDTEEFNTAGSIEGTYNKIHGIKR